MKGRFIPRVMTAVMVVGLMAAMQLKVSAQTPPTPVVIDVSTLTTTAWQTNNSSNYTESQWTYWWSNGEGQLELSSANGNYTLTGIKSDFRVFVTQFATNANVTFEDLEITRYSSSSTVFSILADATINLVGTNVLNGTMSVNAGRICTVTGSGSLTATGSTISASIETGNSATLSLTDTATVNAGNTTNPGGFGVQYRNATLIEVGETATLNAIGSNAGIGSSFSSGYGGNLTLKSDGIITAKSTSTTSSVFYNGISVNDGYTLTLYGKGSITATGWNNSVRTDQNIMMGDSITLTMINSNTGSAHTNTFQKAIPASLREWELTGGASTSSPPTDATINVSVAAGQTGTIKRGRGAVKPGDINGNGIVNVFVLVALLDHLNGDAILAGDSLLAADANEDGVVNIFDLVAILDHINGTTLLW